MSSLNINRTPDSVPVQPATIDETIGPKGASLASTQVSDMTGAGTVAGKSAFGGTRPALPAPSMSAAAMMIALTALNSKIAEEGIAFGESTLEGVRKDIKANAAKRAEQLSQYFEKAAKKSNVQQCGLVGSFIHFFKNLFQGDIAGAFKVVAFNAFNIAKDAAMVAAAVAMVVAAVVITCCTAGGGAATIALAIAGAGLVLGGTLVSDPGVTSLLVNLLPEGAQPWVAMAICVVGAVMSIAGGIMMGIATGGASVPATIASVIGSLAGFVGAAATAYTGIEGLIQGKHQADATRSMADIDVTDAQITDLKAVLDRNQRDLKALFDMFANITESTRQMIATYGQNMSRAAQA